MEDIAIETLKERIRSRMEEMGKNPSSVALEANLSRSAVRDILSGKAKNPGLLTILAIADALECSHNYLLGKAEEVHYQEAKDVLVDVDARTRDVSGILEAGVFRLVPPAVDDNEVSQDFGQRSRKPFRSGRRYIHRDLFLYRVGDRSMNGIQIAEGDLLVAVADPSKDELPEGGLVIAAHRLAGGQVEELSARIVKHGGSGYSLATAPERTWGTVYPDIQLVGEQTASGQFRTKDGGTVVIEGTVVQLVRQLDL